jgi:hypothetical protein
MDESVATDAIISLIPGWYLSSGDRQPLQLEIGENPRAFYAVRELTPQMWELKKYAEENSAHLEEFAASFARPVAIDLIQEYLALKWLQLNSPSIEWKKVLAYFRELSERTYENSPVVKNLVITSTCEGETDITQPTYSKIFDVLSSSPHCFIKVDSQLRFLDYNEVRWEAIKDTEEYKFHPEFLHPFHSLLKHSLYGSDLSVHHTARRDLIVLAPDGIVATKRKNRWKFYDTNNLKNSLNDILSCEYRVGCNLYEILFDLSFRRHGALLIYDPSNKMSGHIVNTHSLVGLTTYEEGSAQSILRGRIINMKPGAIETAARYKRLFLELASVDGALIFSDTSIRAFGAMVETHPNATGQYGARSTAALSAFHYGAHPIKISADGDVRIHFSREDEDGDKHQAELAFA